MIYCFLWLLIFNALGLLFMLDDKRRARKKAWRIPEKYLLLTAVLGGSIGVLAGMYLFRHKTRHLLFTVGVPSILAVQAVVLFWLLCLPR